jgi:hypothetical protein
MKDGDATAYVNRRNVLLAAVAAPPVLALRSTSAEAKMAQTAVAYQQTPKDGKQCDGCNFFVAPNACKIVDGEINPSGYCNLWNKKAGT